ncbi:TetR family transcriptional regulator [Burkholderiales bacterium 8X]|nr:TetR family transcriptional regulator [Burkholderiales bacterium 8X]
MATRPKRAAFRAASAEPLPIASEGGLPELFQHHVESPSVRRLLLAGVDSFWKNGFHASSTREIAKRAKLSPAAVYVHFKSKDELLFTIVLLVAERLLEQLTATSEEGGSPTQRLRRLVQDYVAFPAKMYKASLVANREFNSLNAAQRKQIVKIRDTLEIIIDQCLREGCASGEFKIKEISIVRTAIVALCRSVLTWYSPRGRFTPQQLGEHYADLVVAMVGAKP